MRLSLKSWAEPLSPRREKPMDALFSAEELMKMGARKLGEGTHYLGTPLAQINHNAFTIRHSLLEPKAAKAVLEILRPSPQTSEFKLQLATRGGGVESVLSYDKRRNSLYFTLSIASTSLVTEDYTPHHLRLCSALEPEDFEWCVLLRSSWSAMPAGSLEHPRRHCRQAWSVRGNGIDGYIIHRTYPTHRNVVFVTIRDTAIFVSREKSSVWALPRSETKEL